MHLAVAREPIASIRCRRTGCMFVCMFAREASELKRWSARVFEYRIIQVPHRSFHPFRPASFSITCPGRSLLPSGLRGSVRELRLRGAWTRFRALHAVAVISYDTTQRVR